MEKEILGGRYVGSVVRSGSFGAVTLMLASLNAPSTVTSQIEIWRASGVTVPSGLDHALDCGGDVDGDGYLDIVVGPSPVRVFSGRRGVELHRWVGSAPGDEFGRVVAMLGDLNRDGHAEVAVGAYRSSLGGTLAGASFVFSGADGSRMFTLLGSNFSGEGFAVSEYGDLDGDGRDDFVTSAPQAFGGLGVVRVWSGFDASILREWRGTIAGEAYGYRVASLGDVDADGSPDIGIGLANSEAVEVMSGRTGHQIFRLAKPPNAHGFGHAILGLDDVNGDGHADVAVGSPAELRSGGLPQRGGAVRVFSGVDGSTLYLVEAFASRLGHVMQRVPDINGDGITDFIATSRETDLIAGWLAFGIYSGRSGTPLQQWYFPPEPSSPWDPVACSVGDIDGDGISDLAVSSSRDPLRVTTSGEGAATARGFRSGRISLLGDVDGDGTRDESQRGQPLRIESGRDGTLIHTHDQPQFDRVWDIGDVDSDGHDDYAFVLLDASAVGPTQLISGANGIAIGSLPYRVTEILKLGDVDGDGRADILFQDQSVPPRLTLVSGGLGATLWTRSLLGFRNIARVGDVDGDGVSDFLQYPTNSSTAVHSGRTGASLALLPFGEVGASIDFNRDGRCDLVATIEMPGVARELRVIDGLSGSRLRSVLVAVNLEYVGHAGDLDDDGVPDMLARRISPRFSSVEPFPRWETIVVSTATGLRIFSVEGVAYAIDDVDGSGRRRMAAQTAEVKFVAYRIERRPSAASREFGAACVGSGNRVLRTGVSAPPQLGRDIHVSMRAGQPYAAAALAVSAPTIAPIDLAPLGAPGCVAQHGAGLGVVPAALDGLGSGSVPWTAGMSSAALGLRIVFQAISLDPGANALGITTSNGLALRVGV